MAEENIVIIEPTDEAEPESNENEITTDQIQALERARRISITFHRLFGIALIILSSIIIPLVITTYFYHPGQPDETALLIEQIVGYILAGFGFLLGTILLFSAKRLQNEPIVVVEPMGDIMDEEQEQELEAEVQENNEED